MTFDTWEHANLVTFAKLAYERIQEQDDLIDQLKQERQDAINGYRQLLKLLPNPNDRSVDCSGT